MSLLDPQERSARGEAIAAEVTGRPLPAPASPIEESWRDFIFAEIWNRPGLDRRARYLIAMAGAAVTDSAIDVARYAYGALKSGELSLGELREAALHLAVYCGWARGGILDRAATEAAERLSIAPVERPAIRAEKWDPEVRSEEGRLEFGAVMTFPGTTPFSPFQEAINNFVFGEMWCRYEGLDQRSRRWITLVGVCDSMAIIPMKTHVHAAMASGNCQPEEMHEFVLQYGVHAGWPKASAVQGVLMEMAKKVAAGLPHDG